MISIKFQGRYGNVLWEIAVATILAWRHDQKPIFHTDKYDNELPEVTFKPMDEWIELTKNAPVYIDQRPHKFNWPVVNGNLILEGWFQSYKYLEGYEAELLNLFSIPIKPINKVAIHVRRGDYLEWQESFPVLPLQYYMKAIESFKKNGLNEFIVFSDDIPWCRENFYFKDCKFTFSENDVFEDFRQMCNCQHAIIANSSLSQLAAILNPNPDKVVICPHSSSWYGPKNNCFTLEMCPPEWSTIKI